METNQNDYHVSFFKPTSKKALRNRNMVIWLIITWAIAVFGFQILLRLIEKPVAEPAYYEFLSVWDKIDNESANNEELKIFANSLLSVLSKIYIQPDYKDALSSGFTWSVFKLVEDQEELNHHINGFKTAQEQSENIIDKDYIEARDKLGSYISNMLGLDKHDIRRVVVPFTIMSENIYTDENKKRTETAMSMYLIHNRSFLTDTKILGFPFHYFYTAVFLLILFIFLCWIYCVLTDRREIKEQLINRN